MELAFATMEESACESKSERLVGMIMDKIASGHLKSGMRLPPERELALMASCSRVTVRSALKELEDNGVVLRRQGMGTFVADQSGNQFASSTKKPLGFVVPERHPDKPLLSDPFINQFYSGLVKRLENSSAGVRLMGLPEGMSLTRHMKMFDFGWDLWNGLVFVAYVPSEEERLMIEGAGYPCVLCGAHNLASWMSSVDIDNVAGMAMAVRHLASLGRRRIALLSGPIADRRKGWQSGLAEHGLPVDDALFVNVQPWSKDSGRNCIVSLLSAGVEFDAVIVDGDMASLGAMNALKEAGRSVPENVAFVSYDDYPWMSEVITPAPTAIRQPFFEMAYDAAEIIELLKTEEGKGKIFVKTIQPSLIIRQSCGAVSISK